MVYVSSDYKYTHLQESYFIYYFMKKYVALQCGIMHIYICHQKYIFIPYHLNSTHVHKIIEFNILQKKNRNPYLMSQILYSNDHKFYT